VAERYHLSDEKSVREGLKRGREINRKKWIEQVAEEIAANLAAKDRTDRALRKQGVKRHLREHNIRIGRRRRGANKKSFDPGAL
jgi:hypothetical protein